MLMGAYLLDDLENCVYSAAFVLYRRSTAPTRYLSYANEVMYYVHEGSGTYADTVTEAYKRRAQAGVLNTDALCT